MMWSKHCFVVVIFLLQVYAEESDILLDSCSSILKRLRVSFGGSEVNCGEVKNYESVTETPEISFPNAQEIDKSKLYTVMVIDPDAPSPIRHQYRSWLHYLKVNIPSDELAQRLDIQSGMDTIQSGMDTELKSYRPPSPPSGSGLHRYKYYALEQTGKVRPSPISERRSFDAQEFAAKHNLVVKAYNEFKTQRQ
ncbi:protein D2 isoform X1 [Nematostella vectensis]|uniref:protein D2 isoform X1 n=1 Tax=Nematostella vectensis TaxID=45351 RepID=UPI00139063FD|nr:protein D2 isoform X1 [Nematostella vectensis]